MKNDTRFKSVNPPIMVTHPYLLKEWYTDKNVGLKPEEYTLGSKARVWWKCPKADDHIWQATISDRTHGNNCPFCSNQRLTLSNSLFTLFPDIASQWHPTKNGDLTAKDVVAGGGKKIWWKCSKGADHVWATSIANRVRRGDGCPFCSGRYATTTNNLENSSPELVKEWHPTKNGTLLPKDFTPVSGKKVWWKCDKGVDHEWEAGIYSRAHGNGCPFCANRKLSVTNILSIVSPDLVKEWDFEKNKLKPDEVTIASRDKVYWKCPKGTDHKWKAEVRSRTRVGMGCPVCSNQKIVASNSLAVTNPVLASQWHPIKNGKLTPNDISEGNDKKIWWVCPVDNTHAWEARTNMRKRGFGCPICSNRKVTDFNSLQNIFPEVAIQWHPTKNGTLTPSDVVGGSNKRVWWKCPVGEDHEWEASVNDRTQGSPCPVCGRTKVVESNSLFATHPELAKEWHPTKNGEITSKDIFAGSNKKYWWMCSKDPQHVWFATANHRMYGRGCPFCNSGWTVEKIRLFVKSIRENIHALTPAELYVIFQQNGLLVTDGKGKAFIKALTTGAFPKEELEKFANGEASLVDDFIGNQQQTLEETLNSDDLSLAEDISIDDETIEKEMPLIETKDVLSALNSQVISSADEEAVEFLLTSACAKIWKHAFVDEAKALEQANQYSGSSYADSVKERFLEQYNGAKHLAIPDGYNFKIKGVLTQPNLMQRLVAYLILDKKKVGNWSGTGAGKTLSAILASRVIDSKLTIICCPNAVVTGWSENINKIYPDSVVHIKTLQPKISTSDGKNHYLILNYETFQQENSEAEVKNLVDKYQANFIVIDEIHYSKQRVVEDMSKRKRIITGMITSINQKNANLHVLGMSATPVINNLYEGKALLEMITGVHYDDLKTIPTVNNCMSLYQKLATHGIRWMPAYEQKLNLELVDIDCSDYVDEIKELGLKSSYVDLEGILTKAKLPEIRKRIKEKTIIYTHYLKNIIETLKTEIEKDGWKVAYFTGDDKSGLESFIHGDTDVLIASSSVGTGVDGLQHVCNRLIVNVLPWTHAEFEQLKGRIYRQGQTQQEVDIIVPLTQG